MGVIKAIENYGKNVVGGAKIVGEAVGHGIKKGAQFLTGPLVREMKMQDEQQKKYKQQGKELNQAYSGLAKFKYGYPQKKNY